ncbi:hypothetical protein AAG906_004666 [Vitis piasezkii]
MANDEVPPTPPVLGKKISQRRIFLALFHTPFGSPGLVLISKSLNGDNYSTWKRAMILALNSKNKLGFVNGSIKAPLEETDLEGYATWSRCNNMKKTSPPHLTNATTEFAASLAMVCNNIKSSMARKDKIDRSNRNDGTD